MSITVRPLGENRSNMELHSNSCVWEGGGGELLFFIHVYICVFVNERWMVKFASVSQIIQFH